MEAAGDVGCDDLGQYFVIHAHLPNAETLTAITIEVGKLTLRAKPRY